MGVMPDGSSPRIAGVAAFDFDRTLIEGDSFVPFLLSVVGRRALATAVVRSTPALALGAKRDLMKAALIARLLHGYPYADLAVQGEAFARQLSRRVRPSMAERLTWHRHQGHRLALVSASLDVYLRPLGDQLGFDGILATRLEVGEDGHLTGRLSGANVRRAEKATRLRFWLEHELDGAPYELWAYGDSVGDRELLAMAHHPRRV
jgi:HAD superfamily hydrolase (TIGR01490 family)